MDGAVEVEGANDGVVQGEKESGEEAHMRDGNGGGADKGARASQQGTGFGRRELFHVRGSRTRNPSPDSGNFTVSGLVGNGWLLEAFHSLAESMLKRGRLPGQDVRGGSASLLSMKCDGVTESIRLTRCQTL